MPETYWNDTEMFYVYNDMNNYGALTVIRNKKDFNLFNAFDRVEREHAKEGKRRSRGKHLLGKR